MSKTFINPFLIILIFVFLQFYLKLQKSALGDKSRHRKLVATGTEQKLRQGSGQVGDRGRIRKVESDMSRLILSQEQLNI